MSIERIDKDFISAKASLKCKVVYHGSYPDLEKFNNKDEWGNFVEDWDLYVNKQAYINSNDFTWLQLIRRDKEGSNILQLNFDDISQEELSNFIKDLVEVYKEKLKDKKD